MHNQNFMEYAECPMLLKNLDNGLCIEVDKIIIHPDDEGMMCSITFWGNSQELRNEGYSLKEICEYQKILDAYDVRGFRPDDRNNYELCEYIHGESCKALDLFGGSLTEANFTDGYITLYFQHFIINPDSRIAKHLSIVRSRNEILPIYHEHVNCSCEQCQRNENGLNVFRKTNIYR